MRRARVLLVRTQTLTNLHLESSVVIEALDTLATTVPAAHQSDPHESLVSHARTYNRTPPLPLCLPSALSFPLGSGIRAEIGIDYP